MKKRVMFVLVLLLLSVVQLASAADVVINTDNVLRRISFREEATFNITIFNNQSFTDRFYLKSTDIRWSLSTVPLTDFASGMLIPAGQTKATMIKLLPSKEVKPGTYYVDLILDSTQTKQQYTFMAEIYLMPPGPEYYDPSVNASISMPVRIDPKNPASIKVILVNNNPRYLENVTVNVESKLLEKHTVVDVQPSGSATAEFTIVFDPMLSQQSDTAHITVSYENATLYETSVDYEIINFLPLFDKEIVTKKSFLRTTQEIRIRNTANIENTENVRYTIPSYLYLVTSATPKPNVIKGSAGRIYEWNVFLKPGENATLYIMTDYMVPTIILLVILIVIVYYFIRKGPIELKKMVKEVGTKHGGVSDVEIRLVAKNVSKKTLQHIRIVDRIPEIGEYSKSEKHGVVPDTISRSREHGTVLQWKVESLDPGEVREVAYTLKTKLQVLGALNLKPGFVEYAKGKRKKKYYSNSVTAGS